MSTENSSIGYFYKKIESFDFDRFYTPKRRLLLHVLMWICFACLLMTTYQLTYKINFIESLWMTLRMTTVNMLVFYFFFYVIVPKFNYFNKLKSIALLIFSCLLCGFLWLFVTFLFSKIYHFFGIEITNGELKGVITLSAKQPLSEAISPKRLLSQAIIIFANLSPFFFFKILFGIFRVYNKVLKVQRQKADLEIENINIEKDFLKAQLNPHFLFNTLNNLYGLTLKKDETAPEVILQLSEIMSYTLYESNTQKVPISKELEFIQNYIQLEKMRHSKEKNIKIEISNNDRGSLDIAPLLTFTFIENAFKYGLQNKEDALFDLKIEVENNQFKFYLVNDRQPKKIHKMNSGIGISNTRKRLQLLYPNQHSLEIKENENRFSVKLTIELN